MRQIVYVSSKSPGQEVSVGNLLIQSRRNNEAAGVTGLLYTDGIRFLQVLEGEGAAVAATFARIRADRRHQAVEVLADRSVTERGFGPWAMAHRLATDPADRFDTRMARMLDDAPDAIRAPYLRLIAVQR